MLATHDVWTSRIVLLLPECARSRENEALQQACLFASVLQPLACAERCGRQKRLPNSLKTLPGTSSIKDTPKLPGPRRERQQKSARDPLEGPRARESSRLREHRGLTTPQGPGRGLHAIGATDHDARRRRLPLRAPRKDQRLREHQRDKGIKDKGLVYERTRPATRRFPPRYTTTLSVQKTAFAVSFDRRGEALLQRDAGVSGGDLSQPVLPGNPALRQAVRGRTHRRLPGPTASTGADGGAGAVFWG